MNAIFMLQPWKEGGENGLWVFDDAAVGLRREPFVFNASRVIDALVAEGNVLPDKDGKILLMFSPLPFAGHSAVLDLIDEEKGGTGVTYTWKQRKLDAWLCPAFFKYFQVGQAPKQLYAAAV